MAIVSACSLQPPASTAACQTKNAALSSPPVPGNARHFLGGSELLAGGNTRLRLRLRDAR